MRVTAEIASQPVLLPGGKIPLIVNQLKLQKVERQPEVQQ